MGDKLSLVGRAVSAVTHFSTYWVYKVLWGGGKEKKKPFFESCAKQTNCRKLYRMLVTRVLFGH